MGAASKGNCDVAINEVPRVRALSWGVEVSHRDEHPDLAMACAKEAEKLRERGQDGQLVQRGLRSARGVACRVENELPTCSPQILERRHDAIFLEQLGVLVKGFDEASAERRSS